MKGQAARDGRPGGAGAMGEDKRERANRIANSSDAPAKIDVHWLTSEAIGAWNKVDALAVELTRVREEVERLRAVEAAATTLRARVWAWATVPFRGPGHEEEYDLANNAAEDAVMEAADAYDAALGG